MSNDTSTNDNGTPRSSHLSPSVASTPAWAPPKAPLPPHRLAKLANALGVSTPMPAFHHNAPSMSRSLLDTPSQPDALRRSPTPSTTASMASYTPSVSKYLLHVIPPLHLPHESEEDTYVTPPPANASGYHTQFRRGTLVPVHSTLQAQLTAIAKEYALPSTAGLILYLVSSAKVPLQRSSTSHMGLQDDEEDEHGPRLSEDIWKHLWTRVTKAEQRDDYLSPPSRSHTPNMFSLSNEAQSTPFLPQDGQPLRPFFSIMGSDSVHPQPLLPPFTSSPSTPSTSSDLRSQTKSAPPSSSSVSQSDPETPDTSTGSHSFARGLAIRKESLDFPGLTSPSVIPILAKIEFDIDRRKAAWYDPWLRSRRMNHVKRTESRTGRKYSVNEGEENPQDKYPPVSLVTGNKEASNLMLSKGTSLLQHKPLPETRDDDELSGEGGTNGDELTAGVGTSDRDPVADLQHLGQEEDEVRDLLDHPQFSVTDPPSSPPNKRSSSRTGSQKHVPPRLVIMPNAVARDLVVPTESSPMPSSAGSTHLAYLYGSSSGDSPSGSGERAEAEDDDFVTFARVRSPAENEKREGAVFDDLDLGLDPTIDFDIGDPNDRRRSQFLMKAQLDEIERTMAQLSPGILHTDLPKEDNNISGTSSPSSSQSLSPGKWNGTYSPRPPRQPEMTNNSNRESKGQAVWPAVPFSSLNDTSASPPPSRPDGPPSPPRLAVNGITTSAPTSFVVKPRSSASEMSAETQMRKRALEEEQGYLGFTPPTIPTQSPIIPLSPDPFGRFSSSESGRSSTYWETDTPSQSSSSTLSSSVTKDAHSRTRSTSSAATSRFSVDSIAEEETVPKSNNRSTLMTVNTIKRLWRKSSRNIPAPNVPAPPPPPPAGGRTSMQIPQRPERPSQEQLELPPSTPTMSKFPSQLAPPRPSKELPPAPQAQQLSVPQPQQLPVQPSPQQPPVHPQQLPVHLQTHQPSVPQPHPQPHQLSVPQLGIPQPQHRPLLYSGRPAAPIVAAQMRPNRGNASVDRLHFDQESPYPIRRMPPSPQLTSPPLPSPSPRFAELPLANAPSSPIPPDNAPPLPEKEKLNARKSILKGWKSATSSTPSIAETRSSLERSSGERSSTERSSIERSSMERPNSNATARSNRRPSVLHFGSSRSSVVSPPPDIPPSPQIPQQYVNPLRNEHRQSMKSKLASGSVDLSSSNSRPSPQRSMRSSISSRPSFDTSQFEIVSPRMNSTLSYPYNELDHN